MRSVKTKTILIEILKLGHCFSEILIALSGGFFFFLVGYLMTQSGGRSRNMNTVSAVAAIVGACMYVCMFIIYRSFIDIFCVYILYT